MTSFGWLQVFETRFLESIKKIQKHRVGGEMLFFRRKLNVSRRKMHGPNKGRFRKVSRMGDRQKYVFSGSHFEKGVQKNEKANGSNVFNVKKPNFGNFNFVM